MVSFDELLEEAGTFGRCQKRIFALLCMWTLPVSAFFSGIVFQGYTPSHWCWDSTVVERRESCGWSLEHANMLTLPQSNTSGMLQPSSCMQYEVDWNKTGLTCDMETLNLTGATVTTCKDGWEFDYEGRTTFVTEFNLVCSDSWWVDMFLSMKGVGSLVGSFAFGYFADRYGRKITLVLSSLLNFIAAIGVAVVPNYIWILVFRFIIGFGIKGNLSCFVMLNEIVGPESRRFVGILFQTFFGISFLVVPLLAYFITDWRWLQASFSVPCLLIVSYYWLIPESPRWLISQNEVSKAYEILKAMAKENKREFTRTIETVTEDEDENENDSPTASVLDLFRTPNMRKYTFILMFNCFTTEVVYEGLLMRVGIASKNIYIDFLISAAVEIPAGFIILITIERFGRRLPFAFSSIIAALCCLIAAFIPDSMSLWKTVVCSIGRFGISIGAQLVVFVNIELYPTSVRNLGVSVCSMLCDIGNIVAPFMVYRLADIWQDLPLIVFGVITFIGGGLVLLLPETQGVPLPDTVEDVEFPNRKRVVEENQEMMPLNGLTDKINPSV